MLAVTGLDAIAVMADRVSSPVVFLTKKRTGGRSE